jgi:hypothetical protein
MDKTFGGNTAAVKASSTQGILFHQQNLQTVLSAPDRGDVTSWSCADYR